MSLNVLLTLLLFGLVCLQQSLCYHLYIDKDSSGTSWPTIYAVKDIKRYVYLLSGVELKIHEFSKESYKHNKKHEDKWHVFIGEKKSEMIKEVAADDADVHSLENDDDHLIKVVSKKHKRVVVVGKSENAVLYGAYRFLELLGARFYLHGDVLDPKILDLNKVLKNLEMEKSSPLFQYRGIQPFHDFPEGPDFWAVDDYLNIVAQMLKMRMNFIGLHTYPYSKTFGTGSNEPTVWVGKPWHIDDEGHVNKSYPTSYHSTGRNAWGYIPKNTSDFLFGNNKIFSRDCYDGADLLSEASICPYPTNADDSNQVFNDVGDRFNTIFHIAKKFGIKSCIGTEAPLSKPDPTEDSKTYYEGIFSRIMKAHHLDFYWFWTPESWEWSNVNSSDPLVKDTIQDLVAAYSAHESLNASFELATCGWVLGPVGNRSMLDDVLPSSFTLSSIDMNVGNTPVDPSYKNVTKHQKWVIPWMQDDPGLIALQLWVNRTLLHAQDAYNYDASGLLGIHWHTRQVSPQVSMMSRASWENPNDLTAEMFWKDYIFHNFGLEGQEILELFKSIDSFNMPRPVNWIQGPGGIASDATKCSWPSDYAFIDDFANFGYKISGCENGQRFEWWLNSLMYSRAIAKAECVGALFDAKMTEISPITNATLKKEKCLVEALPLLDEIVSNVTELVTLFQLTVSTKGDLGTLTNIETHSLSTSFNVEDRINAVEQIIGNLPQSAYLPKTYDLDKIRIIVPSARTWLSCSEGFEVEAMVFSTEALASEIAVNLYHRPLYDESQFLQVQMNRIDANRNVFQAFLPASSSCKDIEYYIEAKASGIGSNYPECGTQTVITVPVY